MKKLNLILLVTFTSLFFSCKKTGSSTPQTYTCSTCTIAPEAIVANNNISKGIYKGVIVGSSGTIKFDIANNGSTITAVMVIDGVSATLTSSVSWVQGQAYFAPFTGTLNGAAVSITFSVDASGQTPTVTAFNIPGHQNASFDLVKETSTSLIECFEGTYSTTKPESGTFNLILSRSLGLFGGSSRKAGAVSSGKFDGTISNGKLIESSSSHHELGTLNADAINGSFKDGDGNTVTVTGKRTL